MDNYYGIIPKNENKNLICTSEKCVLHVHSKQVYIFFFYRTVRPTCQPPVCRAVHIWTLPAKWSCPAPLPGIFLGSSDWTVRQRLAGEGAADLSSVRSRAMIDGRRDGWGGEKKTNVCLGRRAHGWEARGPQSLLSARSLIGKSSSWYFISFLYWIYKGFVLHQCAVCIQDLKPLEVEQGAPSGVDPEQRRPGVLVLTDPSWDELWKFARPRRALVGKKNNNNNSRFKMKSENSLTLYAPIMIICNLITW